MQKRMILIVATSLACTLLTIGAVSAITYAAYTSNQAISQEIGTDGYRKTSIFLDVSADLGDGKKWTDDSAKFFLYAWAGNGTKSLYSALGDTNVAGYYVFQIPMATYTHCLFVRADPEITTNMSLGTNWVWNQTDDLDLYSPSKNSPTAVYYDHNLYKITSWHGGSNDHSGGAWQDNYAG